MTCTHSLRGSAGRRPVPVGSTQPRLYQNSCSFSISVCPSLLSESMGYILSGCWENIVVIYTGLQFSSCVILDVQSEKLSHLQEKKPNTNIKNQTNRLTHGLLWGQNNIASSREEEVRETILKCLPELCGMDLLSLGHVA